MLRTLVRRAPVVLRKSQQQILVAQSYLPSLAVRNYAAGGKKKKDGEEEDDDAFAFIPPRFLNAMPKDQTQPVNAKKVSITLCQNNSWILRNEKVDQVIFETETEGTVSILPNHETAWFKVKPGLLTLVYNEDRTEKYFTAGGTAHVFYYGPMQINAIEAYRLDELDLNLVRREVEQNKELLKSRNERTRGQAQIALELYEPLLEQLEKTEFM
jgi:F-type H+-transporting ATPase subunit delta